MAKYKHRDPLAWGIILIVIGFIFLLYNINVKVWDYLARLWPVILIIWGIWKLYFGLKEGKEKSISNQDEP